MRVQLDYGRRGLETIVPDDRLLALLETPAAEPLADADLAIEQALARPIGSPTFAELARGRRDACILICDKTRPAPNERMLRPMLRILEDAGMPRDAIRILIATGLHRSNLGDEIVELVGPELAGRYRVENHDGKDRDAHAFLGVTPNGVPAWIDRRYVEADLKIATGLIEPHFMAGFSGGRKLICPGIAAIDTIRVWHSPRFLEHPNADSGIVVGNPVHEENTRIATMAGCDFIVNACIDGRRRLTSVVAGDMIEAWEAGVAACRRQVAVAAPALADVVLTSGAGYPLDATFYQSVKGMNAALPVVKPGGTVIVAAEMSEGVGSPEFRGLLEATADLDAFRRRIWKDDFFVLDQWQLAKLAKARARCAVMLVGEGLPAETLRRYFVEPYADVETALADALERHGPGAKVAVIPKGPYALAAVESEPIQ